MKNGIALTEKERDQLAVDILTDAIIFEKVASGMIQIQSAGHPSNEGWPPESQYNGITNALCLYGYGLFVTIQEENEKLPIADVLRKIFNNTVDDDNRREMKIRRRAVILAEDILREWKSFLNALEMKQAV